MHGHPRHHVANDAIIPTSSGQMLLMLQFVNGEAKSIAVSALHWRIVLQHQLIALKALLAAQTHHCEPRQLLACKIDQRHQRRDRRQRWCNAGFDAVVYALMHPRGCGLDIKLCATWALALCRHCVQLWLYRSIDSAVVADVSCPWPLCSRRSLPQVQMLQQDDVGDRPACSMQERSGRGRCRQ